MSTSVLLFEMPLHHFPFSSHEALSSRLFKIIFPNQFSYDVSEKKIFSVVLNISNYKIGQPRQHIKKHSHHFARKGPYYRGNGFTSSHLQM